MLVSLTAGSFDLAGSVVIDVPSPDWGETKRRASRVATLDGGAVVSDFGYTDSDRTITLNWRVSDSEDSAIRRIIRYHERANVSTPLGLMSCIVQAYSVNAGVAQLTLLPVERLSE